MNPREVLALVAPMRERIRSILELAEVRLVVEAKKLRDLQLWLLGEITPSDYQHMEPYGFTARPIPGAEAVLLNVSGDRSDPIVIQVTDRRYRIQTLAEGEVAIYDDQGAYVKLGRSGIVVEPAAAGTIKLGESATKGAARLDDLIQIDASTDPVFSAWAVGLGGPPVVQGRIVTSSAKVQSE